MGRDFTFAAELRAVVRENLRRFERRELSADDHHTAAVAVVVVPDDDDQAAVILTIRAMDLRRHSGQFAFPGGRCDPGESAVETALRELAEEVGIELGSEDVLGLLDDFATRSGFVITPVVVWGREDFELVPDPREVASAPLVQLADLPGSVMDRPVLESESPLLALSLLGTEIYAPTAAILHQFSEVAVHGRETRVAHFEQPRFAWR